LYRASATPFESIRSRSLSDEPGAETAAYAAIEPVAVVTRPSPTTISPTRKASRAGLGEPPRRTSTRLQAASPQAASTIARVAYNTAVWLYHRRAMKADEHRALEELKRRNTELIGSWGLEVNEHLPVIESSDELSPPSAAQVAARACALGYVVGVGFDADRKQLVADLQRFDLWNSVSRNEQRMLIDGPSKQDEIDCTWRTESIQALAFCLGLTELSPERQCDDDLADNFPLGEHPGAFIDAATLRPRTEVQERVDLYYRLHWYVRNCQLHNKTPERVIPGVVVEHRRALDWVHGVEADWDEVPMDT